MANWEDAGIQVVSYRLIDLLMKPGLEILEELDDIRHYIPWRGEIILNASLPKANREGIYRIRSSYDGVWIRMSVTAFVALITQLKPDGVILPTGSAAHYHALWQKLPKSIKLFWHVDDSDQGISIPHGDSYFLNKESSPATSLVERIETQEKPSYLVGEFGYEQMGQLALKTPCLIESDTPAQDGMTGVVYSHEGSFSILSPEMVNAHQPLDSQCQCQTCRQSFTRAYLHHLLQHTPLLAQRFLVQHNVYFCQNRLMKILGR
jgi:queuine tRNA-ribosyltransferase